MSENSHYSDRFSGISRLYGQSQAKGLQEAHVAVIGIGGVGSWSAEAIARSGVGKITLIDLDDICITNSNRQIHTLHSTIGQQKVDAMATRIQGINPECNVRVIHDFFTASTAEEILSLNFDFVIDAIDSLNSKVSLLSLCHQKKIPVVTVGGAGGRRNPSAIKQDDLSESFNDGLLRRVRKKLRAEHGFPDTGSFGIPSVFSIERLWLPTPEGEVCLVPKKQKLSYNLDCNSGFGTASFVTGTFGFTAAAIAMAHLTGTTL
ncbi:tRNA threonylcarbamoyladenosine dehydratase [Pseudobacteriovorax antillogorgiicola]|uniref:tRNA A37 threonylcarbamoyladenosine dehydratase n=1 Tax=Pseudobacteriovorax antillogorgiicola TaxID=1513793 RepID=A0A1Y6BGZ5_9BACT|nr:tRNA threonylcarbamoyladenosine dehydratase [Pseudobacteriovorax antillogorgiicola]TCS55541.1 tRNA A37 threonylcarbamoyladenosine dehydratase [Pseudobacteriovorax antillogorgiicola]SMF11183.1 tRNA A37 threonylcarbamoyladenosine dehydratase [Pseudobacteriovorax antillogorgiicola]